MRNALLILATEATMKLLKRIIIWFQIYELEITISGQTTCLDLVGREMQFRILAARMIAKAELARLRSEYNATFPPGQRRTWKIA